MEKIEKRLKKIAKLETKLRKQREKLRKERIANDMADGMPGYVGNTVKPRAT